MVLMSLLWYTGDEVPAKNSIKEYEGNAYYHIYNRGVEKRNIFLDDHDYSYFLYCLKLYLSPQQIFTDNPKGYFHMY